MFNRLWTRLPVRRRTLQNRIRLRLEALEDRALPSVSLISTGAVGGVPGDFDSGAPSVSGDGRYVAFQSGADNLVPGLSVTPDTLNVYVRDRHTGTTTLVSENAAGTGAGNFRSFQPVISRNGRYVAFESYATDLVTGVSDTNGLPDIFVRDLVLNTTTLVSVNAIGTATGNLASDQPQISGDGRYVAFRSLATDLVPGDTNGQSDIFVRDLVAHTTTLASVNAAGTASGNGASQNPVLSADGGTVAFVSYASDLVPGDTNGTTDVFARDLRHGTTTLVSVNAAGTASGNNASEDPSISDDGDRIAFSSSATDLVAGITDVNAAPDVFVRDLTHGTTMLASIAIDGQATGNGLSGTPALSGDGHVVAFRSRASNLVGGADNNNTFDVFVRDLVTGQTALVSVNASGTAAGNSYSQEPALSRTGRFVTFVSAATDLTPGVANATVGTDVFVRDMVLGRTVMLSANTDASTAGDMSSDGPVISANGRVVAFASASTNLAAGNPAGAQQVYAAVSPTTALWAAGADAGGGPNVRVFAGIVRWKVRDFMAYDPLFQGGVRVAMGDVNGDGVPDVITAPGPGGGPDVRVWDGVTGKLLLEFMAYDPRFSGGLFVAAADLTGAGHVEIITAPDTGGGPDVRIFDGATGTLVREFMAYDAHFQGGVRPAVGDVEGTGLPDLITAPGPGGGPDIRIFHANGTLVREFMAYSPRFAGGVFVAAGDVLGDGRARVITAPGAGGGPDVRIFGAVGVLAAEFLAYDGAFAGGVRVAVLDVNACGGVAILTASGPSAQPQAELFCAPLWIVQISGLVYDVHFHGGVFVGAA
jgi:Tol biopolymer transport system component